MPWEPKPAYRLAENTVSVEDLKALAEWLTQDVGATFAAGAPPWVPPHLTQGPLVRELEQAFAKKVGAKHAIFVNSGSSANLLAWYFPRAYDWLVPEKERTFLPNGDEDQEVNLRVVVPAVAWSTSVMPAYQFGYAPIACEADPETWGLDPVDLRRICENVGPPAIVVVVHVLGVPAKMKEIDELRREFGFLLIEDACGAFGSSPVGKIEESLTTYSTFFAHQMSTIEGGFITTNGDDAANVLRMLRAHGWAADCDPAWKAALAKEHGIDPFREKFTFYVPGFNVRNTDLAAHLGLSQMKRADAVALARRANHGLYATKFSGSKDFAIQKKPAGATGAHEVASIAFGVLASSKAHRNKVAAALQAKGIETRPIGGGNMARQPFFGKTKRERPLADRIHDCGFQLPNGPHLTVEDVAYLADTVLAVRP